MNNPTAPPTTVLPRRKRLAFALVAVALGVLVAGGTLVALDLYLHGKYQRSAGFNMWGYRGPVVGRKAPGEYRVVVLGGSSAFGYGVEWSEAFPAVLERKLKVGAASPITVVNLAYNNEGAYSFKYTLQDYAYLDYDLAILYEGYNDIMGGSVGGPTNGRGEQPNLTVFRHDSAVFRLTGYLPIVPIIVREKAAAMTAGDAAARAESSGKTVFGPGQAARTAAAATLRVAADVGDSVGRQLGRASAEPARRVVGADTNGCKYPWAEYCQSVSDAVAWLVEHGKQVLAVTQPYELGDLRARHSGQQHEMSALIQRRFGDNPRVRYLNLGERVDLADSRLSFDRMHLTASGNERLAEGLVEPVRSMASAR